MSKRKRPSVSGYLDDFEETEPARPAKKAMKLRQEQEPPDPETGTQMMAFRIPKPLANELRGAAKKCESNQASILRQALERELSRLRSKYNEGEPFPSVTSDKAHRSRRL